MKSLHNTTANGATKNVKDIVFWGNGDTFKLIAKASSEAEGWMKSTKAMEIEGVGCVVQVTTQQRGVSSNRFITPEELAERYPNEETRPTYKQEVDFNYAVSDAVTFVPGVKIYEELNNEGVVIARKLVSI